MSDHDLLIKIDTQLSNHLHTHDFITKIALTAGIVGILNFFAGICLIYYQYKLIIPKW